MKDFPKVLFLLQKVCATRTKYMIMNEPISVKIGRIIRKYRKHKNISQTELGDQIGVAHTTVSRYETGKLDVPIYSLPQISDYCGFSAGEYIKAFCTDEEILKALNKISMYIESDEYRHQRMPYDINIMQDTSFVAEIPDEVRPLIMSTADCIDRAENDSMKAMLAESTVKYTALQYEDKAFVKRMMAYLKLLSE